MLTEQAQAATQTPHEARQTLQQWETYQQQNSHLFPTGESWRWFVRQHRPELIERGALCFVAGRLFVLPQVFDLAVVDIGRRLVASRIA